MLGIYHNLSWSCSSAYCSGWYAAPTNFPKSSLRATTPPHPLQQNHTPLQNISPGQFPGHKNLAKQNIVSPSCTLLVWSESWHSDAQAWKELWTNIISTNYTCMGLAVISFQVTFATTYFSHTASFSSPGKIKFDLVSVSCQNMVLLSLSNYLLQWSKIWGFLH